MGVGSETARPARCRMRRRQSCKRDASDGAMRSMTKRRNNRCAVFADTITMPGVEVAIIRVAPDDGPVEAKSRLLCEAWLRWPAIGRCARSRCLRSELPDYGFQTGRGLVQR